MVTDLKKCQASVVATHAVELRANASPWAGSPFFHLFFHDILGSSQRWECLKPEKTLLSYRKESVSMTAFETTAHAKNRKDKTAAFTCLL